MNYFTKANKVLLYTVLALALVAMVCTAFVFVGTSNAKSASAGIEAYSVEMCDTNWGNSTITASADEQAGTTFYPSDIVELKITPDDGYGLVASSLTVRKKGSTDTVQLLDNYSFEMPSFDVCIEAEFVQKAEVSIKTDAQTVVYDGDYHLYEITGTNKDLAFSMSIYTDAACQDYFDEVPVDAGTYYCVITYEEDDDYFAYESDPIQFTIEKASFDLSNVTWNYTGPYTYDNNQYVVEVINLPEDLEVYYYKNNIGIHAGEYVTSVVFDYDKDNYNQPVVPDLTWEILKADYDMTEVKWNYDQAIMYDGTQKTVELQNLPWSVYPTYENNSFVNVGSRTAKATLKYDEVNYNPIQTVYELKWDIVSKVIVDQKERISIITNKITENYTDDIKLVSTLKLASKAKYDYSSYVDAKDGVSYIYELKFVKVVDGEEVEVNAKDLFVGKYVIKFKLPSEIDNTTYTSIVCGNSQDNIKVLTFNPADLDENGYYKVVTEDLSEFAFVVARPITEVKDNTTGIIISFACGGAVLLIIIVALIIVNTRKDKKEDK